MRMRTSLCLLAASGTAVSAACSSGAPVPQEPTRSSLSALTVDASAPSVAGRNDGNTRTPIKHVIVIIGENRSFDHVFATYKPKGDQRIVNLLSKGIINEDGTPGANFRLAVQKSAVDSVPSPFELSPGSKAPYAVLPRVLAGGPTQPFLASLAEAQELEGSALPANYLPLLLTGGTGLASGVVDTRLANATTLPPGPFQLTPGIGYDAYSASPVHRFYEMVQQVDCSTRQAAFEK